MKRIFVFTVVLFSAFIICAQDADEFSKVLLKRSSDVDLVSKLKAFKLQGIEKDLEMDSLITMQQIIDTAMTYIGTPHSMGGLSHKGIDCSGLLYISFTKSGVKAPRTSEGLAHYGKIISSTDSLQKGDLIFFVKTYKTSKVITHSGIALGDGKFIHTSASRGVVISDINSAYYQTHFIFGTRVKGL